jgi:hypothetical protein
MGRRRVREGGAEEPGARQDHRRRHERSSSRDQRFSSTSSGPHSHPHRDPALAHIQEHRATTSSWQPSGKASANREQTEHVKVVVGCVGRSQPPPWDRLFIEYVRQTLRKTGPRMPGDVRFFGSAAVVADANGLTDPVKQPRRIRWAGIYPNGIDCVLGFGVHCGQAILPSSNTANGVPSSFTATRHKAAATLQ